jgi:hypothetical protein
MKTISLPYTCSKDDRNFIKDEIRKSSNMLRFSYKRFQNGKSEKEIRLLSKDLKNISTDSWLIQCAIKKANYLFKTSREEVIFGGKFNFFQRLQKKISNQDFKEKRLLAIYSQGELQYYGNRKFRLDIANNQIIFKFSRYKYINLQLPKLHKNYLYELLSLEEQGKQKLSNFSVELKLDKICITFDDSKIYCSNYKGNENVVGAIDMNPNWIGFSISKWNGNKRKILLQEQYDLSYFTRNLHKASNHKDSKYQNNKQIFELKEIAKDIIKKCKFFHVGKFGIEDLNFKVGNSGKGRGFNRLTKNKWKRDCLVSALKKQCLLNKIDFVEVNPVYSSFIGNLCNNAPDPIAASLEIARRANFKYIKGKFYPELIDKTSLFNLWKESSSWVYKSWKELFDIVKTAELKYRRSLESFDSEVFRLKSSKSFVNLYKIYNCLEC